MPWNGLRRRAADQGKEDPMVILARIDERVANLSSNFTDHKDDFNAHRKEDKENFDKLNRAYWVVIGGAGVVSVLVKIFFK